MEMEKEMNGIYLLCTRHRPSLVCSVVKIVLVSVLVNVFPALIGSADSMGCGPHIVMPTTLNAPENNKNEKGRN